MPSSEPKRESRRADTPKAIEDCHALLGWMLPQLDKFPRARRFTLGSRIEDGLLFVLEQRNWDSETGTGIVWRQLRIFANAVHGKKPVGSVNAELGFRVESGRSFSEGF